MQNIDILGENIDVNKYTLARCQNLSKGYLYQTNEDANLFKLLKSFCIEYQQCYTQLELTINSFYTLDEKSIFLDELLTTYGLPNVIFQDFNTIQDKVVAINTMKMVNKLLSIKDFEIFFLYLGYKVKFYHRNTILEGHMMFDYTGDIFFIDNINGTGLLTYWFTVEEDYSTSNNTNNTQFDYSFDIEFTSGNDNARKVQIILDYIKPSYIIVEYLTNEAKRLLNL